MNLQKIPKGGFVFVDANIFIYAMQRHSRQCVRLLQRCAEDDVTGFVADNILAEVMHVLMIAEARDNNWITSANPARQLNAKPKRVAALHRYESLVRDILGMGLRLESLQREDFLTALSVQRQSGLLTNDALLVAMAIRLRIPAIASADKAFARAQGIKVYSPSDLIPES